MKHTLLIHQAFVSPYQAGGTRHYEFAQLLTLTGNHHFTIIASDINYLTGKATETEEAANIAADISVLRAYTLPITHKSFSMRVAAFVSFMITSVWVSRRAKNIDLVIGTTPPMFQACSAWLIAAIRHKPFLLEVRDLWPEFAIDMGVLRNPILIKFSRWLEAFLYNRATHILVNSPAYRDYMYIRGIPREKVTLIPNGVDPTMFANDIDGKIMRIKYGLGDKFIATYAGALGQANDIGNIIRAAALLTPYDEIHFLIVGDGKEKHALEQRARELGLSNMTFTGALPKTEMPQLLAASNVCIATLMDIPMFRTTYPNKVFDYMAAERPTILGIDGVIREVVEAAAGGLFVPPGNEAALAETILHLFQNPSIAEEMGRNARSYVVEHFNRTTQVKDFGTLIKNLVGLS